MNDKELAAAAAKRTARWGVISGLLIALYALFISREHITDIGTWARLTSLEAGTLFIFVDFVAIYGKLLTSKRLAAKTRRIGYKFMMAGGGVSLLCNIGAGIITRNIGESVYGAFIVGIVGALEYAIANTKAKAVRLETDREAAPARATTTAVSMSRTDGWSPARRAAQEARKAAKAATTWAPSAEDLDAEFGDELAAK